MIISVPSVDFAVGFSVGIDGRRSIGPPAADELVGVGEIIGGGEEADGTEGGDEEADLTEGGGEEADGTEGGGDGVVDRGGTFVEGGEGD